MTDVERRFHQEMLAIYQRAAKECGYRPTRFLQMVNAQGGLAAAKALLATTAFSEGLTTLWQHGRLDLTIEDLVLRDPWRALFSSVELDTARQRLRSLGRDVP